MTSQDRKRCDQSAQTLNHGNVVMHVGVVMVGNEYIATIAGTILVMGRRLCEILPSLFVFRDILDAVSNNRDSDTRCNNSSGGTPWQEGEDNSAHQSHATTSYF